MKIQICPIKRLYQIIDELDSDSRAIISSSSDIDSGKLKSISYVCRQYEDIDYECAGRSFSYEDAAAFADFLKKLDTTAGTLYCCCDAGESRSPAVAAAVMLYLGMDDMFIWRNPRYHPNMWVFAMLTEVLGCGVTDEEKDLRFYTNQKAFRDAINRQRSMR
jgi:hypothetical protein